LIEIKQLKKAFGKQQVLKGIDLKVEDKGITAILGPNGSGKTTLIKSMLGLVVPDTGDIIFQGQHVRRRVDYRKQIGYMSQISTFPEHLSVKEVIAMIKDLRGQAGDESKLIETFGLQEELNKKMGHLSGGTRQKVNATLAFMFDSPFLVCDEPTVGLDPVSLIYLKELMNEQRDQGKAILLITHIMSLVEEVADQVVFLQEGKIYFQGTPQELLSSQNAKNIEEAIANMLR
jgi:Cu-processing system ATP-binding protein